MKKFQKYFTLEWSVAIILVCAIIVGLVYSLSKTGTCYLFDSKKANHPTLVVVNVLEKKAYDDCHIAGSIHIDFSDLGAFERIAKRGDQIVVYCSNYLCSSSDYVAKNLEKMGYKNVLVYAGGMAEWYQHGLPVEGPARASYLKRKVEAPAPSATLDGHIITMQELATMMGVSQKQ